MRDQHLISIEKKIQRIRFYKTIGKMIFGTILIILLILIISNTNSIMMMQTDTLNQIVVLSQEIDEMEQSINEPKKVSTQSYNGAQTRYGMQLSDQEQDIVCRVVMSEARGEDLQGQMAVAQVIRDRMIAWDMTVTEVVTAPSQFAKPYSGEISDSVYLAVTNVFDGNMSILEVPTTHFHADYVNPYWTDGKTSRGKIGVHKFYY